MLTFFPNPYPDEALYSVFARYHIRAGNINYQTTKCELFGNEKLVQNISQASQLEKLINNLPFKDTNTFEDFLYNNTLYPFYAPFAGKDNYMVLKKFTHQKCTGLVKIGFSYSNFKFCPSCNLEDYNKYGELYWHRVHQIQGILICPTHKTPLYYSSTPYTTQGYIHPTFSNTNNRISEKKVFHPFVTDNLYIVSKDCEWLLNNRVPSKPIRLYRKKFRSLLELHGYKRHMKMVNSESLSNAINNFYGQDFFTLLSSENGLLTTITRQWLNILLTRQKKVSFCPMRYILLSNFLGLSISQFISE